MPSTACRDTKMNEYIIRHNKDAHYMRNGDSYFVSLK